MLNSAISIQGLAKQRGRQTVLSALNLVVSEGERLGLAGLNGAGKTTLIKCLLDLDTASSGEITVFNRKHSRTAARQHLAYLPDNFRPPGYLRGHEFLDYMSRLHGAEYKLNEVAETLAALDLEVTELDKLTRRLSKGAAQKLGLAACLLSGKKLLVMDEPLSGLDPHARVGMQHCLQKLKRQGRACFFTTHLLADAERICDRIAILHEGSIRYVGSVEACCRKFRTTDLEQAFLSCVGRKQPAAKGGNGRYIEH